MAEVPLTVWRLGRNSDALYVLVLRAEARDPLPMIIGPCEAMAIWGMLGREKRRRRRRAVTHDLLRDLIETLGGRVVKVVIDDLWNGVYYAKLHIALDGETVAVDARPSDAVAVALRAEAPLYATESVLTAAAEPEEAGQGRPPELDKDLGLDDL